MQDGRLPVHYAAANPEAQALYQALLPAAGNNQFSFAFGPKKVEIFTPPPPPPKMPLVMDSPHSKPLRTAPYKQQVH